MNLTSNGSEMRTSMDGTETCECTSTAALRYSLQPLEKSVCVALLLVLALELLALWLALVPLQLGKTVIIHSAAAARRIPETLSSEENCWLGQDDGAYQGSLANSGQTALDEGDSIKGNIT